MAKLTAKQTRFVEEYLVDLNGTQAAIRAGYSEDSARSIANENLTKPDIVKSIDAALKERSKRVQVTQDMVVAELKKIAFADIRNAVRWGINPTDESSENAAPNGLNMFPVSLVPSEKIDDDTAAAVAEVSLTHAGVKIKMHDKKSALVDLGKHLGMFVEKSEVRHSGGLVTQVELIAFAKDESSD